MQLIAGEFPTVALHRVPDHVPAHVLAAVQLPLHELSDGSRGASGEASRSETSEMARDASAQGSRELSANAVSPDEQALANTLSPSRRSAFLAGRVALRAAANAVDADLANHSALRTSRGAPTLPPGLSASISHKRHIAVALASKSRDPRVTLGVDIEDAPHPRDMSRADIGKRILTAREHDAIAHLEPLDYRHALVVRFSIKEAIYKAIDPRVQRYVAFTEVELDIADDGTAQVTLMLREVAADQMRVHAAWWSIGSHVLAAAEIRYLR